MWQRKSMMVVYSMLKYRRSLWYASCCRTLLTPWLKRMYVCAYTPRTMFARCAHVRTLTRRLRWNCCSAAAWLLNNDVCWSQHHRCDAKASLFQRIWWRRLPDCWWCWSWLSSQDRVRPAVVWTSVWDVLRLLWRPNCHALSTWGICVDADVDLLHVESFFQEVADV